MATSLSDPEQNGWTLPETSSSFWFRPASERPGLRLLCPFPTWSRDPVPPYTLLCLRCFYPQPNFHPFLGDGTGGRPHAD